MIKTPDRYWKAHVAGVYTVYVFWHSIILPIYPVLTIYRDWIIIIKKKQEWSKGIDKNIIKRTDYCSDLEVRIEDTSQIKCGNNSG